MPNNWICSNCKAYNPPRRNQCWQCGTSRIPNNTPVQTQTSKLMVNQTLKILVGIGTVLITLSALLNISTIWPIPAISENAIGSLTGRIEGLTAILFIVVLPLRFLLACFYILHIFENTPGPNILRAILGAGTLYLPSISMPLYFLLYLRDTTPGKQIPRNPTSHTTTLIHNRLIQAAIWITVIWFVGYAIFSSIFVMGGVFNALILGNMEETTTLIEGSVGPLQTLQLINSVLWIIFMTFCFIHLLEANSVSSVLRTCIGLGLAYLPALALPICLLFIVIPNNKKFRDIS